MLILLFQCFVALLRTQLQYLYILHFLCVKYAQSIYKIFTIVHVTWADAISLQKNFFLHILIFQGEKVKKISFITRKSYKYILSLNWSLFIVSVCLCVCAPSKKLAHTINENSVGESKKLLPWLRLLADNDYIPLISFVCKGNIFFALFIFV